MTFTEIITIYSPTSNMQGCLATHTLPPNFVSSGLFIFASLIGGNVFLAWGLCFVALVVFFLLYEIEHFFHLFSSLCVFYFLWTVVTHVHFLLDSGPLCWAEILPRFLSFDFASKFLFSCTDFCLNAVKYLNTWFYDFWILHHG